MNRAALDIPDDPARLPRWLHEQLLGPHLRELAAELAAVHAAGPPADSVRDYLGNHLGNVRERGLGVLPAEKLRGLLRQPYYLLELQPILLAEGGAFWDESAAAPELMAAAERDWRTLAKRLFPRSVRSRWYARPWAVSLATAAAVLLIVLAAGWFRERPPPAETPAVAWGWARVGTMPQGVTARAYLESLADAAEEWFKRRPDDALSLAGRLGEFRQGCSRLLLGEHRPLSEAQRDWLRERCRKWAALIDRHLAEVENGRDPVAVRADVDGIVRKLVGALRAEATRG